jgi:hypothetical protein
MKSLTYFLVFIITFTIFVNGLTVDMVGPKNKKAAAGKKGLANKAAISLPNVVTNPDVITRDDEFVCDYGKNLGLLRNGNTCTGTFRARCRTMIKRQEHLPRRKQYSYLKARGLLKGRKGLSLKLLRSFRKSRWTLKGRIARFRRNKRMADRKKRIYRSSSKKFSQSKIKKLTSKQRRLKRLRKEAERIVDRMMRKNNTPLRKMSRATVKRMATRLAKREAFNIERAVAEERRKRKALERRRNTIPSVGNFCVHSVAYNLNHCCHFKVREDAQKFANTQPGHNNFQNHLFNGRIAEENDKERIARRRMARMKKLLKLRAMSRKGKGGKKGKGKKGKKGKKGGK